MLKTALYAACRPAGSNVEVPARKQESAAPPIHPPAARVLRSMTDRKEKPR